VSSYKIKHLYNRYSQEANAPVRDRLPVAGRAMPRDVYCAEVSIPDRQI